LEIVGVVVLVVIKERFVVSDDIHDIHLEVFFLQEQVLMLAVNVHQQLTALTHQSQGHRCVVDKRSALAIAAHLSSKDTVRGIVVDVAVLKEIFEVASAQIKMRLNNTFASSFFDLSGVSTLPQEQVNGSKDDAFTSSRLTGYDRESWMKINVEFIDEREVLNV
jgi:hypothetical protein